MLLIAGRHRFVKQTYKCSSCNDKRVQGTKELLQAGLFAASNHPQTQTYTHSDALDLLRHLHLRSPGFATSSFCKVLEDISAARGNVCTVPAQANMSFFNLITCVHGAYPHHEYCILYSIVHVCVACHDGMKGQHARSNMVLRSCACLMG